MKLEERLNRIEVNKLVVGSIPTAGANYLILLDKLAFLV